MPNLLPALQIQFWFDYALSSVHTEPLWFCYEEEKNTLYKSALCIYYTAALVWWSGTWL